MSMKEPKKKTVSKEEEVIEPVENENSSHTEEAETKIKELEDKLLRVQAETQNYKRRKDEETERMVKYANEQLVEELLPVLDNFERAIDSFKAGDLDSKYVEGLNMIYKDFLMTLNKNGLEEIKALNCEFDPNRHHAVMQVEADEEDENQVKEIFQKGYMLKTKVIRPSMVKVAIKN